MSLCHHVIISSCHQVIMSSCPYPFSIIAKLIAKMKIKVVKNIVILYVLRIFKYGHEEYEDTENTSFYMFCICIYQRLIVYIACKTFIILFV